MSTNGGKSLDKHKKGLGKPLMRGWKASWTDDPP